MTNPYQRFKPEDLILRDELAFERTLLANERTLLAYLRSGVALILAGITFVHFSQDQWFRTIGLLCLPAGTIILLVGGARYRAMNSKIVAARERLGRKTTTTHDSRAEPAVPVCGGEQGGPENE